MTGTQTMSDETARKGWRALTESGERRGTTISQVNHTDKI